MPLGLLFLLACGPRPPAGDPPIQTIEFRQLDTLVVAGRRPSARPGRAPDSLPVYRGSPRRTIDLLHTALDLHFDWEEESVTGTAILRLTPFFFPTDQVSIDAKGMRIHAVRKESGETLAYSYTDPVLGIRFDRTYAAGEEIGIIIDYTAYPSGRDGTSANRSDKGFFFVQAEKNGEGGPQFWTQGETEDNSKWFPTLDQPNERATQEIRLTVADTLQTLSNGILVSARDNGNGTRTDHWKLDLPHAPYLAMVAAGRFRMEEEVWNGIPLQYYVEDQYPGMASEVYPHTPEMLDFFSTYFQVPFPWPKYAQIAVREFVAGAMENTTAVIFGDFMLRGPLLETRQLYNEEIVAHELVHHWFGNLVTCESWANLPLNEGFASYGEYLWLEHHHGREIADLHMAEEWQGYFAEAGRRPRPLIYHAYTDPESLFDRHSYNKGGAVLHMLRHYVGDTAFRAALSLYLRRHAYKSVEIHDLRLAFEETTGEDFNWFFDQWFMQAGHPQLTITYRYDEGSGEVTMEVIQTQRLSNGPAVFRLPAQVEIRSDADEARRVDILVEQRQQTFRFPTNGKPTGLEFDPDQVILSEREETYVREN